MLSKLLKSPRGPHSPCIEFLKKKFFFFKCFSWALGLGEDSSLRRERHPCPCYPGGVCVASGDCLEPRPGW